MTLYTAPSGTEYHVGGLLPNDPRKARVRLNRKAGVPLDYPVVRDWTAAIGADGWPMLGNNRLGNCVACGCAHGAQEVNKIGQGLDSVPSEAETIGFYSAISGYDPRTGRNDNGATLQDGLHEWQTNGVGGNRIVAFAQIKAADEDMVKACIDRFGLVLTGFSVPQSAMDQFDAGQPWTVVQGGGRGGRGGSAIVGRHCVPLMGYDTGKFRSITWAKVQDLALDFYRRYFVPDNDVWVPVDPDLMRAGGTLPNGMDAATANIQFRTITGQQADPFPTTVPPVDPPAGGDPNAALVAAFGTWRAAVGA